MLDDAEELDEVQTRIEYRFNNLQHLRDALTHRSFVNERPHVAPRDNERLEFLGDAILDLAASTLLWLRYPDASEGELSQRRADLVCERSLAAIAAGLALAPAMRLGRGEEKSGGRNKPRLIASALEALIAAVYLDSDQEAAVRVARHVLGPFLEASEPGVGDYKSRLQERLQGEGRPPPSYALAATEGPDHDRLFSVEVRIDGASAGAGRARSKLAAEQLAAKDALTRLGDAE